MENLRKTATGGDGARSRPPLWLQCVFMAFFAALAAAIGGAGGDPLEAWHETVGPSRLLAILFLVNFVAAAAAGLPAARSPLHLVCLAAAFALGLLLPLTITGAGLILSACWLCAQGRAAALPAMAMAALGAHAALFSGAAPAIIDAGLRLDSLAVGLLVEVSGRAAEIEGTTLLVAQGRSIRLIDFCGSLWPALTVLAAVSTFASRVSGIATQRAIKAAAAGVFAVIALNWLRLTVMTTGQSGYDWFHEGTGTTLFRLAMIAVVVVASLWAYKGNPERADRKPRAVATGPLPPMGAASRSCRGRTRLRDLPTHPPRA